MRARPASITDLPISPDEERQRRFRLYLILMLVRVAALGVFFIVPDWWKLIPAFLAVFLPYFAVVIANASTSGPVESGRIAPNALPAAPTTFVGPTEASDPSASASSASAPSAPVPSAPEQRDDDPREQEPREPEPREPAA